MKIFISLFITTVFFFGTISAQSSIKEPRVRDSKEIAAAKAEFEMRKAEIARVKAEKAAQKANEKSGLAESATPPQNYIRRVSSVRNVPANQRMTTLPQTAGMKDPQDPFAKDGTEGSAKTYEKMKAKSE
jgi:hypothetical protein